jgi:hypothetical protein
MTTKSFSCRSIASLTFGSAAFDSGSGQQTMLAKGTLGPLAHTCGTQRGRRSTGSHVQQLAAHPEITGAKMWQNLDIYNGRFPASELPATFVNRVSDALVEKGVDTVYISGRIGGDVDQDLFRFRFPTSPIVRATPGNASASADRASRISEVALRSGPPRVHQDGRRQQPELLDLSTAQR